ncbi:hypothetical protein PoB_002678500 [Plakobranchus ocellatus]|uniref:Uncharacterized protein n=1 Tax=Plakobranchus ocellatus TaxID=259542 RepID=A0AAV3ZWP6_9GAST|nr:hypothetical protein PoB_002678500 [Plakobranchus ocellatus]
MHKNDTVHSRDHYCLPLCRGDSGSSPNVIASSGTRENQTPRADLNSRPYGYQDVFANHCATNTPVTKAELLIADAFKRRGLGRDGRQEPTSGTDVLTQSTTTVSTLTTSGEDRKSVVGTQRTESMSRRGLGSDGRQEPTSGTDVLTQSTTTVSTLSTSGEDRKSVVGTQRTESMSRKEKTMQKAYWVSKVKPSMRIAVPQRNIHWSPIAPRMRVRHESSLPTTSGCRVNQLPLG